MTILADTVISFTRGTPADHLLPHELLATSTRAALEQYGSTALQYGKAPGFEPLRAWLAADQRVPIEQIILGNGSLNLLYYIAEVALQPGDTVLVENPTYDRARLIFEKAGAQVIGVPLEADGIAVDALPDLVQTHQPRLMYLINDFQNPSGTCTSLEKRQRIAEIADQHGITIIDDSAYYPLRYQGASLPQMRDLLPERTFTLGSFSKLLAPGVRTGWLIAPEGFATDLVMYLEHAYIMPNLFAQAVVTQAITSPDYERHLQNLIATYRHRLHTALTAVDTHLAPLGVTYPRPEGGFFIGLMLPPTSIPIWETAREDDLVLLNGDDFFTGRENTNFVRVPFCSLDDATLIGGVERLAGTLRRLR